MSDQDPSPPRQSSGLSPLLFRLLGSTRLIFLLAILSTYLATVILLILGSVEMFEAVLAVIGLGPAQTTTQIRLRVIEAVDLFLVATILYVISVGLYQLFINTSIPLPSWLVVHSATDMESKLIGVLITILGVFGLEQVTSWQGGTDILALGVTVALLIFALAYFVVNHGRHEAPAAHGGDEPPNRQH